MAPRTCAAIADPALGNATRDALEQAVKLDPAQVFQAIELGEARDALRL